MVLEDIVPFFEAQMEACGTDYFDFYLFYAVDAEMEKKLLRFHAYEHVKQFKEQGHIRHIAMSFHDTPEVLDAVLCAHPEIEAVQIQFNYLDYESPEIQSRGVYEVCRKHNKPMIVMEPVKGGSLAMINEKAAEVFRQFEPGSPASFAIRYAAGFEGIFMTLSGMSNLAQMKENLSYMKEFRPLNEKEQEAVQKVVSILKGEGLIACTACRYCTDGCPMNIDIPSLFKRKNELKQFPGQEEGIRRRYERIVSKGGKASDCIECGQCEEACPQHLPIRELLKGTAAVFEA